LSIANVDKQSADLYDLVIQGGTLLSASETVQADLGIRDGVVAALGHNLQGAEVVDARGLLVLPGAVDPHVHLAMPAGATTSSDNWETGTIAAACGGTTTVIDFIEPGPGEALLDAFEKRRAEASDAAIDYGLHMTLTQAPDAGELSAVVAAGMPSFKTYTTYEGFRLDDATFLRVMQAVRDVGGLILVHAESDAITAWCRQALLMAGETGPQAHPRSRPAIAEGEAIARVLALAKVVGVPLYIVHISTALGATALAWAQAGGQLAYGETCPQYLLLTDEEYERPGFEGAKFVCAPPLRAARDNAALWEALAGGTLSTVGTDHCPFNYRGQKDLGRDSFPSIPGGLPGVESRLALLYTFGVRQGRISLNRWVEVCCTAPARLFGLYPRKGTLLPGADADVVLFDPEKRITLSQAVLHENVDYTPYEGLALHGYPVMALSRGHVVAQAAREGPLNFVGKKGHGQYLARALSLLR